MAKADIRAVVESYGGQCPPDRGGWQTIRCPFHEDRTKSARINYRDGGAFRCFACDIPTVDAIGLVMKEEHTDFPGAVDYIENTVGAAVENLRSESKGSRTRPGVLEVERADRRSRTIFQVGRHRPSLNG